MVKVSEVMKKEVVTASPELRVYDAAKIMTNNRIGSVVVLKGENPIDIITDDDIVSVIAQGKDPKKIRLKDIPQKKGFITASPGESVMRVTRRMLRNGVKRLPVIDKGKLVGIISDKEILTSTPEMIDILSEKLKYRIGLVAAPDQELSGICENCESYSDNLRNISGRWLCEDCREY